MLQIPGTKYTNFKYKGEQFRGLKLGFLNNDREQIGIIGYSIDDFVEEDSKARFIVKIVESLNTKELYSRYSDQGADALDPKALLSAWFLGYSEGITSTRKLEYSCKKHLDFIYISANLKPDHSSLSRFRKRHLDLIPKYFLEIIEKASMMGLSEFKEVAIDGTKLKSVSSKKKSIRSSTLAERIKEVEKDIGKYLSKVEKEDSKIEKLKKKQEKLKRAERLVKERKSKLKPEARESHQVNIEEPEAFTQNMGKGKESFPGYNTQIGTDTKTQLIVSGEVVQDRNDKNQFLKQHKNIEDTLGLDKERAYVADGGYNNIGDIEKVYKEEIDGYIGSRYKEISTAEKIKEGKNFTKEDFRYDKAKDCYICPAKKKLRFWKKEKNKDFSGKRYRSEDCSNCLIKHLCLGKNNKSGKREIRRDDREKYVEKMKKKIETKIGESVMFRRKTTVEAVIGNLKSNIGYTRFRLKGLAAVNGEFKLMCIGHNLNKLFKMMGSFNFDSFLLFISNIRRKLILRVQYLIFEIKIAGI